MLNKSFWGPFMPGLNWAMASLFTLLQFMLQASSGLMASSWQREFHIDASHLNSTQVGFLSSAFYLSYVAMQIPVGLLYDRFGARKIISIAALLMFIGTMGLALSHQYWQAFLARLLMGVGSSFGFVGMLYVTSSWFSGRYFALLVGISETLAMLGVAFGELGMAWIITQYGWRNLMFLAAIATATIACLSAWIIRDNRPRVETTGEKGLPFLTTIKQALSYKQVWLSGAYGFALFSIITVFVTLWGVPYFTQFHHLSLSTAGAMMSMVFIGTGVGAPIIGWIVGRWKKCLQFVLSAFAAATALCFGLIIYVQALPNSILFVLLFLVGFFSASYIQVFAIIRDTVAPSLRATALGTTNMVFMLSAPVLQPIVGKAIELQYSFTVALTIIEVLLIAAVGISFGLIPKNIKTGLKDYRA